jgi:hypothetical protein
MSLLDALQVLTYSRYFKDILANKYEIATLGVDHVKMSEQCSAASMFRWIREAKMPRRFHVPLVYSRSRRHYATLELV